MSSSSRKRTFVRSSARLSVRLSVSAASACSLAQAQTVPEVVAKLDPVIVTASRSAQPLKTAPIGATVITADDIRRSGVVDANEAIRKIAGVVGRTDLYGGREQTLDLRGYGSTADNNLVVLVDGVRISENEQAAARLTAIPIDQIERIEIVRGGSSVLWGEGASAGAINVILKKTPDTQPHATVAASVESFSGRDLRAVGSAYLGPVATDLAVRHVETDGYRDNNAYRQDSASAGAQIQVDRFKLAGRLQTESQAARLPGSLTFAQFDANPRQTLTPGDNASTTQNRYSLFAEYGWSGAGDWLLQADAAQRQKTAQSALQSPYGPYQGYTTSDGQQFSPHLTHQLAWSGWGEATTVGFDQFNWDYLNTSSFQNEQGRQTNRAVYLHTDWTAPSATRLTAGARKERVDKRSADAGIGLNYDNNYEVSATELGLNQSLPGGFDIYGRWSTSYRLPNIDDLRNTLLAPAQLRAQRNRDVETGVKWQRAASTAALRVFRQHSTDEIGADPTGWYNINMDPTERRGVELEGAFPISEAVKLSGSWQHLVARFRDGPQAGNELPLVAPNSGTARVSYNITPNHLVDVGLQYRAAMRFGDDQSNTCTKRIPSATFLDARYAWTHDNWELAFAGTNLTDRQTYSQAFSCTTGGLYPDTGRALKLSATWHY